MWTIKTKTNFSFSKLLRKLPKIIEEVKEEVGKETIGSMQETINKSGYGEYDPLTTIRKSQRKEGVYFPDKVRGTRYKPKFGNTPLKQTGALYDSMKYTKKGIEMLHYGLTHNDGKKDDYHPKYRMSGQERGKPRQFIDIGMRKVKLDKVEDKFYDKIDKSFKK